MKRDGFSLLELLVVIAIIGVLASIVIANVANAIQRSRQKATMADLRTWATAEESAFHACGAYPVPYAEVGTCAPKPTPSAFSLGFVKARLLSTVPVCDGWHRPFVMGGAGAPPIPGPGDPDCTAYFPGASWTADAYTVYSRGSDGIPDCGPARYDPSTGVYSPNRPTCEGTPCGAFGSFRCDPTIGGGAFVARPKGFQK